MIDLTKKSLPNTVSVGGRDFSINTDFRVWMRFEIEVSKLRHGEGLDVSYLFKGEMPNRCDLRELFAFSRPVSVLPKSIKHSDVIVFDYEIDADYIYSAFMSQYGIDLLEVEELHWHKFLALFKGLKESEVLCKIMAYRCYEKHDGKKDVYADLKRMWTIEKFTPEEEAEREKFNSYFE